MKNQYPQFSLFSFFTFLLFLSSLSFKIELRAPIFQSEKSDMIILRFAVICCLTLLFVVFPLTAESSESSARCAVQNVRNAYADAKAVFAGRVLSVEEKGGVKIFTFQVEKRWKGAAGKKVRVSAHESARYQAWFEKGKKYLVYAEGGADGKLWEQRCSRSKLFEEAAADIKELKAVKKPAKK